MMSNPVSWFEIAVSDMDRARRFYETVLQQPLTSLPNPDGGEYWAFPMQEDQVGAGGALTMSESLRPGAGGTLIYFQCHDCAVEQNRVEPAGGRVLTPKRRVGKYGCVSICRDSEGNTFGLYSQQ